MNAKSSFSAQFHPDSLNLDLDSSFAAYGYRVLIFSYSIIFSPRKIRSPYFQFLSVPKFSAYELV